MRRQVDNESVTDAQYRKFTREQLVAWTAQPSPPSRAARVRQLLVDDEARIRPLLREILSLRLEGARADPVLHALANLKGCYDFPPPELYDVASLEFIRVWQPIVDDPDRSPALRAYAAATLWAARRGLRGNCKNPLTRKLRLASIWRSVFTQRNT